MSEEEKEEGRSSTPLVTTQEQEALEGCSSTDHDTATRGEALRLRGGHNSLVGCNRDDHLAVAHPSGGWQHDLHESDGQGSSQRTEAPLMDALPRSPSPSHHSPYRPHIVSNIALSLDGSAEPLTPALNQLSLSPIDLPSTSSEMHYSATSALAQRATRRTGRARRQSPFSLALMRASSICGCFSRSTSSDSEDIDVATSSVEVQNAAWTREAVGQRVLALRNGNVPVHKIVEFTYELVPEQDRIFAAPYYWGRMDRFLAERLLADKPEGTFLLRDSAQPEFIFSVSFRRYGRTLHARIEQANGSFGFDVLDDNVFCAPSITKLIENYNDPGRCLFFEPQLTNPLNRNFVFSLQELCRGVIASHTRYVDIPQLGLPPFLRQFISQYHYSHPVRTTITGQQG